MSEQALNPLTWKRAVEDNSHSLLAIRHGQTTYNVEDRCATTTDVPLTEHGRQEALAAAISIWSTQFDGVFSSPMSRAIETARLMQPRTRSELVIDSRLREPPAGPFEGQVLKELWSGRHKLSPQFDAWMSDVDPVVPEGAEPVEETAALVQSFLDELADRSGRYLAFSHGGLIRIMASIFAGNDPRHASRLKVDNCHAVMLKWYPKPPHQVLAINLPPSQTRGRLRDPDREGSRAGTVEVMTVGPKAAAAYAKQRRSREQDR